MSPADSAARPIQPMVGMLLRAAGTGAGQGGREVTLRQPDLRMMRIETGHHDLADSRKPSGRVVQNRSQEARRLGEGGSTGADIKEAQPPGRLCPEGSREWYVGA